MRVRCAPQGPARPLSLEYTEVFRTKNEALARETYFKTPEGGALKQRLAAQE